jgi:molybdopterin-binding protein
MPGYFGDIFLTYPMQIHMVKTMKLSARNQIPGTVKSIRKGPVSTEVVITIAGGNEIVSSITTHSAESLKLREGSKVYAVVKASEVMVGID